MTDDKVAPVQSILFVCSMNSVRSPIAEGIAKELFGRRIYIDSAGLRNAARDPFALSVLREVGIEFSQDEPRLLEAIGLESFDLVITLSQEARGIVSERVRATAVEHIHWPMDDPTLTKGSRDTRLVAYRVVRDRIRTLLKEQVAPRIRRISG